VQRSTKSTLRHASAPVDAAVAALLAAHRGAVVAIGFSGGRDSAVLTDACARLAPAYGVRPVALHVHHGLSPNADAWAAFAQAFCAQRDVRCEVERIRVARSGAQGLEAAARHARYAALAAAARAAGAAVVALAHHGDDQAETVLLQLMRGAGPAGLAAMAALRTEGPLTFARPFLPLARADIAAHAALQAVPWIDDESNADTRRTRNAVRHDVMPVLERIAPGSVHTLARAAAHQAEAAELLDALAALDAADTGDSQSLSCALLARLPESRARNALRWFLRRQGLPAPSTARLAAMLAQLRCAPPGPGVRLRHGGRELGVFRGRIVVHEPQPSAFAALWVGEGALRLPHGTLAFRPVTGAGLAAADLCARQVTVRSRAGGERMRVALNRPRRSLKALLQEAGMPPWQRGCVPLLFVDDQLACVPGIGVDPRFRAGPAQEGYDLVWTPDTAPR
jgi:tRNA(Ile)-lysidine synthase